MDSALPIVMVVGEFAAKTVVAAAIILRSRSTPAVRLSWLVIVFAVPVAGIVAYLLFGENRLGRRRIQRYSEILSRHDRAAATSAVVKPTPKIPNEYQQIAHLAEAVGGGNWARGGNALQLFGDTQRLVGSIVSDIERAESHCHLEFYIFLSDRSGNEVADALIQAVQRGVSCRLLVDGVGSKTFLRSELRTNLARGGVHVVEALPARLLRAALARIDLRNHRKIAVIDGSVGYVGSQNIADASFAPKPKYAPWVDCMVRVKGPAVTDLHTLFLQDWAVETGEFLEEHFANNPAPGRDGAAVQILGTGPMAHNEAMLQLSQAAINTAREELIITSPYFVPDEATAASLHTAARRGVETRLVVPARNDSWMVAAASRSYYRDLLDAGVSIYEYRPGLLHAKTMTCDRQFAVVTSANLDRRSFELNFEVSMVVYDSNFASQLRFLQMSYIEDSTMVDAAQWIKRGWPIKLWHNAVGMLSPLL